MRVKELREEHGWSMRDLAKEAGVSLDTVQAMEHGSRPHRPSSVKKVADPLGVSVGELKGTTSRSKLQPVYLTSGDRVPAGAVALVVRGGEM
jgi:transcriptional regulator with XRE-family HTH domain